MPITLLSEALASLKCAFAPQLMQALNFLAIHGKKRPAHRILKVGYLLAAR